MRRGEALDDADRAPWLAAVAVIVRNAMTRRDNPVIACSALKETYRAALRLGPEVIFVFLRAGLPLARERLVRRAGHFMHPNLAESQFDALEERESAIDVDAALAPGE